MAACLLIRQLSLHCLPGTTAPSPFCGGSRRGSAKAHIRFKMQPLRGEAPPSPRAISRSKRSGNYEKATPPAVACLSSNMRATGTSTASATVGGRNISTLRWRKRRVPQNRAHRGGPKGYHDAEMADEGLRKGAAADGVAPSGSASLNAGSQDELQQIDFRRVLRQFWDVAAPYWMSSSDKWQARIRLAAVFVLTIGTTAVSVVFSFLGRDFFNALESRNQEAFVRQLLLYLAGYVVGIPVFVLRDYLRDTLALRWRAWLTDDLVTRYMACRSFYAIQTQGLLDNPDQRINDDAMAFADTALSQALGLFNAFVDLLSFSGILYSIYPPLFGVVFVYASAGTIISALLGKDLVGLNFLQEKKEADFRYGLVRVRENAESIAFYGGEASETKSLLRCFQEAVTNYSRKLVVERNLSFFTLFYQYLIQLVPVAVLASLFFQRKIEFGVITQAASAFNSVLDDCSFVVYRFQSFSAFTAVTERLGEFKELLEAREEAQRRGSWGRVALGQLEAEEEAEAKRVGEGQAGAPLQGLAAMEGEREASEIEVLDVTVPAVSGVPWLLKLDDVTLFTPSYSSCLFEGLSLQVRQGEHLLVAGPSGSGKTSLLRSVAGLWQAGSGRITRAAPEASSGQELPQEAKEVGSRGREHAREKGQGGASIFFLPQKPYMVLGTLRDQLLYPTWGLQPAHTVSAPADSSSAASAAAASEEPSVAGSMGDSSPTASDTEASRASPLASEVAATSSLRSVPGDEELLAVLERVRLGYLAERWEGGLGAEMEWASTLSLGEQQRIAFARLLLSRPSLALLDEATSALDEETEGVLYEALRDSGVTFVSVGHRSSIEGYHSFALRFEPIKNAPERRGDATLPSVRLRLENV